MEHNDIPMMAVAHHESGYWATRVKDSLDRLHMEGGERAKVLAVAIHPYISGQPHRIKYLEEIYAYAQSLGDVLFWNGEQILDWYQGAKG
uniref:CAZy families CE4 protein n=1 Tax=uncultured Ralstonia sp. TaxID=114715 RepID=A0A060CB97_9RALS|nr:CAZy families CE4 protein [uncultured Ralstonia sp.]